MRAAVWVLDPKLDASRGAAIVAELAERRIQAEVQELPAGRAVVVRKPPANLAVPADVVRSVAVELPSATLHTRRAVLDAVAGAIAVAAVGAGAGVAISYAQPPASRREDVGEIEVARLPDLQAKGSVRFRFGREPCVVVLSGGELFALSLVCTHLGCLVEWSAEKRRLLCPCHAGAFDLEGNVVAGPPPRPLTTFAVSVVGERVLVKRRNGA